MELENKSYGFHGRKSVFPNTTVTNYSKLISYLGSIGAECEDRSIVSAIATKATLKDEEIEVLFHSSIGIELQIKTTDEKSAERRLNELQQHM